MAFLDQEISLNDIPQSTNNFEPIPAGWYSANITGAELKSTKAGNGSYIAVRYDITGPTHEGRVVFGNINIRNPNPQAETIGRQQLGDIMRAIGLTSVKDTDQLIGTSLMIKVSVREDEKYGASNDIKGHKAIHGSEPPKPAAKPAKASAATPPWQK
jgi:hypothetical protein